MKSSSDQHKGVVWVGGLAGRDVSSKLFWHLSFCAGKLSDVLYLPPWRIMTRGGKGKSLSELFPPYGVPGGYRLIPTGLLSTH